MVKRKLKKWNMLGVSITGLTAVIEKTTAATRYEAEKKFENMRPNLPRHHYRVVEVKKRRR